MPIQSYKMGPGTLKLGAAGVLDVSCQVTSLVIAADENVDETDPVPVLCGEELAGDTTVTYTWGMTGTLLQDLTAAGVVDWSWINKGLSMAFLFVPNTAAARKVTGNIRVTPIAIGGDAKTRPTSDIDWTILGTPVFAAGVV
jgi:hypothetical protein